MTARRELLMGNIEPLLLYMFVETPMYGYQIIRELENRSQGYFKFKEGTLYPVLHRMESEGLIIAEWRSLDGGRQRKYYNITPKGAKALVEKRAEWRELLNAVAMVTRHATDGLKA
jgi:PadR family transcriptional regulator PadR